MPAGDGRGDMTDGFNLVVDALRLNGVKTIYGVVGIPVTDLARVAQAQGIRYIGFRQEQAAGHAAAAAGFLTQRPGICLTVSAPGFLNGLPALANATTDCFPMIQIAGSSDRAIVDLHQGDYEELDQMNTAMPLAKEAFRVERPEDIGIGVARAIRAAVSGRPGGVYLDLPAAVLGATLDATTGRASVFEVVDPAPRQLPAPEATARALDLLAQAQRPLIIIGKGAAYARAEEPIRKFPQWSKDCRFVQVDIDSAEMDSNRPIAAPVTGDIHSAMTQLVAALRPGQITPGKAWLEELDAKKAQNVQRMAARLAANAKPMNFSGALRAIRDVLAEHPGTYVVNEGANTLDFGRDVLSMFEPRHRLDSGTWGVMGVGMGYAIAAAVESGKPVVAVEGDSAFGFSGMELETICRYKLPIITVIFNNGGVYKGDEVNRYSADPAPTVLLQSSRYEQLGQAFGGEGYYAETPDAVTAALREAFESGRPAVVNCLIDPAAGTESGHLSHLNPEDSVRSGR